MTSHFTTIGSIGTYYHLSQTDSIAQVKIIKDEVTSSNAGYCFIDFFNPESAQEAVQLHGTLIPGTHKMYKLNWTTHSHANNNSGNGISIGNIGARIPSRNLNFFIQLLLMTEMSFQFLSET